MFEKVLESILKEGAAFRFGFQTRFFQILVLPSGIIIGIIQNANKLQLQKECKYNDMPLACHKHAVKMQRICKIIIGRRIDICSI